MQETSTLYRELLAGPHYFEVSLAIGDTGVLITGQKQAITFGGHRILAAATAADGGFRENHLQSLETAVGIPDQSLSVGGCTAGSIRAELLRPAAEIPRQARMVPYVRVTDGVRCSEWIQKGVFYLDTRQIRRSGGPEQLILTGYDDILKAERPYPASRLKWPAADAQVTAEIAEAMGVNVDSRTWEIMKKAYPIQYPGDYSCREVLGYLAAMYAGNFVMSDLGELLLVPLNSMPKETGVLVDRAGCAILFGGVSVAV